MLDSEGKKGKSLIQRYQHFWGPVPVDKGTKGHKKILYIGTRTTRTPMLKKMAEGKRVKIRIRLLQRTDIILERHIELRKGQNGT